MSETVTGYILTRTLSSETQQFLTQSGYQMIWSDNGPGTPLNFITQQGFSARFLVTGRLYYLSVNSNGSIVYLRNSSTGFTLTSDESTAGRVFLYFPVNGDFVYPTETNLTGYVYVAGNTIGQARLLWTNLTDMYRFDLPLGTILAQNCSPNCPATGGCNQDSGCGIPCGCSGGQICLDNGSCQAEPRPPTEAVCPETGPCGGFGGTCGGNCPAGYLCARDSDGKYYCQQNINWGNVGVGIIIGLVILGLLVAIGFLAWRIAHPPVQYIKTISVTSGPPKNYQENIQTIKDVTPYSI